MNIKAGFAMVDFTPAPGLPLQGQMHERIAERTRDPLFACAAAFDGTGAGKAGEGGCGAVLVAVDVCILDNEFVANAQRQWAQRSGLAPESLLLHATHTHVAPVATGVLLLNEALPEFQAHLTEKILQAAAQAWQQRQPAHLFAATGFVEHLGWNRRAMFEDGTSRMYSNAAVPGFIGLEGPRDGAVPALWARDEHGTVLGVLTGFASHPNCMESELFYSADLPGETRRHLGAALGGAPVVYLTGAAGNTAPSVLERPSEEYRWRGERGAIRSGQLLTGEVLKLIAEHDDPMVEPAIAHARATLDVPRRDWPATDAPSYPRPLADEAWSAARPYYEDARDSWPRRVTESPTVPVNINVVRIGDVAVCTNPAELFVEFGLDIKVESAARVTFVSELTDGYCGYVPTKKAFSRGGYETWCAPSSQLAMDAGERIVAQTKVLLGEVFP